MRVVSEAGKLRKTRIWHCFVAFLIGLECAGDRGKRTPTSVRRRSSWVDFRLRNPSSPDVVFVMKALFSILDPQNRVETKTCFVFAHDFVIAVRYLLFTDVVTPPRNLSKLKKN